MASMCNPACIDFGISHLRQKEICGKRVLEVGALDVNGSLRSSVERFSPGAYVGVDIVSGPGVDLICDVSELAGRFGKETFDLVISTELLEHVRDWRKVVANLKTVLRPGGVLLITTRSRGYPYHGYPFDYWRYEPDDMRAIFSDCDIEAIERDHMSPGVFVKAVKPGDFTENDLADYRLYSVIKRKRCRDVGEADIFLFNLAYPFVIRFRGLASGIVPESVKKAVKAGLRKFGMVAK